MSDARTNTDYGRLFWAGVGIGALLIGFGVDGLLTHLRASRVLNVTGFVVGAGLGHDAVWAPLLAVGALATHYVPISVRRTTRVALAASAGLVLFSVPLFAGGNAHANNPSVLPLDYARNLAGGLAAIWLIAGAALAIARRRGPRR